MKKVILLLFAVCAFTACSRESVLLATKMQTNLQCPITVDGITTLEKVVYDIGSSVFLNIYTIDESQCPMSLIRDQLETLAENIKTANHAPGNEKFLKACKRAQVKIMYQYCGSETNDMCWITYFPETDTVSIKQY